MKEIKCFIAAAAAAAMAMSLCACGSEPLQIVDNTVSESAAAESVNSESSSKSSGTESSSEITDTESTGAEASSESTEETGSAESSSVENGDWTASGYTAYTKLDVSTESAEDAEDIGTKAEGEFTITSDSGSKVKSSGSTYTITEEGTYTLSGVLEGNIIVDAQDAEVELVLDGVSISCDTAAPIYVEEADKVKITAEDGKNNVISDLRAAKDNDNEVTDASDANAAIYSCSDLTIKGEGALVVTGEYNNGIQSKKDLEIKNLYLKVTALNTAVKGNDSVTIESGSIIVISTAGDAIKTDNSSVTEKGNQKGNITIFGGTIDVYAAKDGISAAYDACISGDVYLNIYTDSYSEYSDGSAAAENTFYIVVPQSDYSDAYDYYAYYYNSDMDGGKFVQAEYSTDVRGSNQIYCGLKLSAPSGYENAAFFIFNAGDEPDTESYVAATEGGTVNSEKNAFLFKSISDNTIEGSWTELTSSSSGSNKTEYSAKGIKAENNVDIEGGTITIQSSDDGIHANAGTTLESGAEGAGTIEINGGYITITTKDDGMHADTELTIDQGYINVITSYEGLEANRIEINNGRIFVYATDDGVNASTAYVNTTATVTVNGGYLDVATPSGDTDAIDSNGNYVQTGGYVLVKGGASTGSMAGSIDVDGTVTVTGGAAVCVGGICETPSDSVNAYALSGQSMSAGDYVLSDASGNCILSFTLDGDYSSVWIASELLETGTDYELTCGGSSVLSWTQEEGTMGSAGTGMGGFGGFGGMGGGHGGGPH